MSETLTIEDVMEHVGILSGAGFADGAFFERSGRTRNSELAGNQIATSGAAITNAYRAQVKRIAELEIELVVADQILETRRKLLEAIPECPVHGHQCVPHAIERVQVVINRVAELEAMLIRLQWHKFKFGYLEPGEGAFCTVCLGTKLQGHYDYCELAALLPEEEKL